MAGITIPHVPCLSFEEAALSVSRKPRVCRMAGVKRSSLSAVEAYLQHACVWRGILSCTYMHTYIHTYIRLEESVRTRIDRLFRCKGKRKYVQEGTTMLYFLPGSIALFGSYQDKSSHCSSPARPPILGPGSPRGINVKLQRLCMRSTVFLR
jgi:hypothetical protein